MPNYQESVKLKILESASVLFAKFGLSKTTIEDIAKSMKMGKSSLYYYYKNKEEIFQAVINKEADLFKTRLEQNLASAPDAADRLRRYTLARMMLVKEFANTFEAFTSDYLSHYAFIHQMREKYDIYETALIHGILQEGMDKGLFRIQDVNLTSYTLFLIIRGLEYDWTRRFNPAEIETNVHKMLEVLLNGISTQPELSHATAH